ncbi:hypothetical protein [Pedobacter nutrimenti]|uniref:Uncharacterized protein n=1 Tax=Pedobacter nutrimenti TaxID=1241337 RepID=A0A318UZH7_9SPHI|nr:hypothetical protein [Pedobacter nutrimenti]PYF76999.1 hypothetical protein B0O44_101476 [Pedobacter nutrimenti]
MKTKKLIAAAFGAMAILAVSQPVHAQFLKKLKDKVNAQLDKKVDDVLSGNKNTAQGSASSSAPSSTTEDKKFFEKAALSYNFSPGKDQIFADDFSKDASGRMALSWKTGGSGSVEKFPNQEGKWLIFNEYTSYKLKSDKALPSKFTIEFDLATHSLTDTEDLGSIGFGFAHDNGNTKFISDAYNDNAITQTEINYYGKTVNNASSETKINNTVNFPLAGYAIGKMHVEIAVNGQNMLVYLDKVKVLDTDMFLKSTGNKYFYISAPFKLKHDAQVGISNFRLAAL